MARIPLGVIACDRGANGVPTSSNPRNLSGRLKSYAHTIAMGFGFESLRVSWDATPVEVLDWLNAGLMRPITSYSPSGRVVWDGLVSEITVTIGQKKIALSLDDMANRISVRYSASGGASGLAGPVSSASSIALYGTKERLINLSNVSSAAASARANTVLTRCAFAKNKQPSTAKTGPIGAITIELAAMGWYGTLDWLLTSSTSTTVTATHTQVLNLLTSYAATNPWLATTSANVTATGVSDVETIDADSTYRDKIETVLALGNSASQPLHWGIYENRAMTIEPWAGASPSTITYTESARTGEIRDTYGNIVAPWDVRPNAMVQVVDVLESGIPAGAIDSIARKFVARVSVSLDLTSRSITLEGDDVDTVDALIASPAGAGPAGHSARQAKFERKIKRSVDTTHPSSTGSGGGGGTIGIGGGGTGGSDAPTARTNLGAAPNDAQYLVATADSELTNEQNLGALASGMLKQSVSGGVATLAIAVAGTDYVVPSSLNELIDDRVAALLQAGANITLTYNDPANTLTIAVNGVLTGSAATNQVGVFSAAAAIGGDATFTYDGSLFVLNNDVVIGANAALNSARLSIKSKSTSSGNYAIMTKNSGNTVIFSVQDNGTINVNGDYYYGGTRVIAAPRSGWTLPTGTASRAGYNTATATLTQVAQTLAALLADLNSWHGLIA